jgi:hypothetical protein
MSIDISYLSFDEARSDEAWKGFEKDLEQDKDRDSVSEDTMYLNPLYGLSHITKETTQDDILRDLMILDLNYGALICSPYESGKHEMYILQALADVFGIADHMDNPFSKEEWIDIYSRISEDSIKEVIKRLSELTEWPEDESRMIMLDFFKDDASFG